MFKKGSTKEKVRIEKAEKGEKTAFSDCLKSRKTLGIICIATALILAFAVMPLVESFASRSVDVLIADTDLKRGELITEEKVKVIQMGAQNLPYEKLEEKSMAVGKYASVDFIAGDIVTTRKISSEPPIESAYLNALANGQLAISIMLNRSDVNLAGKFRAGDLIRIYEVIDNQAISHNELLCIEVLAVTNAKGEDIEDSTELEERRIETVTLAVNDKQAERLAGISSESLYAALVYRGEDEQRRSELLSQVDVKTGGEENAG